MKIAFARLWRVEPAASVPSPTPLHAFVEAAGCTAPQGAGGLMLAGGLAAGAMHWAAYAWLGIFCILLMPLMVYGCAALLARTIMRTRVGWAVIWAIALLLLGLSAFFAQALYWRAMSMAELPGLSALQVWACVLGFGSLVILLPIWQAQARARALQLTSLQQAVVAAELKTLQAQVEPHFLYNTLANARHLTRYDGNKAAQMLDHLIAYLRSALPDMRSSTSTLAREFQLAEHYLALMAIRYGERLTYRIDIPETLRTAAVPPLMLMSLVENAIKHGVEPQPGAVNVALAAAVDQERLRVVVRDNGLGLGSVELGRGVGLRNLRERLAVMYGAQASFQLRSVEHLTEAELCLPLQFSAEGR